ncbi:4a-hydroxytetrahydrobiopterin dehydratase [Massilia sp. KIM]|uniref:4a-hydroxytetrahydrobiopterin dehydratase n=1 Tax=Massilia sp. KIM TaxID=1955422 RepID=UPI00098F36AB|nr:4a-hydroxytetrahydrobiopterin dehydratase [Massilia sp. KIM]OON63720.1 4a-hydroxytetrahydrobiopterin dehydratase [Massilia sp. KIM]
MKLADSHCVCNAQALEPAAIEALLPQVPDWRVAGGSLEREYAFPNFRATIAFVNAVATMADGQHHHPELRVGYGRCGVSWTTHSAGNAITKNDLICAARCDALYRAGASA